MKYKLSIGWLYPDLMSTYGDRGNIICLQKRCEWRGIDIEIINLDLGFKTNDLKKCDLLFMGGAQDRQQQIVAKDLTQEKIDSLKEAIEHGIPGLYICGAYQFLGKYYKEADETKIPGLNILDLYTENPGENHKRLIGNIIVHPCHPELSPCHPELVSGSLDSDLRQNDKENTLVGFENHGGRTYLGKNVKPFGKVIKGFGNNGTDGSEGAIYKNSFGTYLHGPILPKNPNFADYLIKKALEVKYEVSQSGILPKLLAKEDKKSIDLSPLDDSLESQAKEAILKRLLK